MVCLHVTSPSLSPCSLFTTNFNIVSVVMDNLMGKMGCTPILSIKVSTKKIKGAVHKNGDVDGTCKQNFMPPFPNVKTAPQFTTQPV